MVPFTVDPLTRLDLARGAVEEVEFEVGFGVEFEVGFGVGVGFAVEFVVEFAVEFVVEFVVGVVVGFEFEFEFAVEFAVAVVVDPWPGSTWPGARSRDRDGEAGAVEGFAFASMLARPLRCPCRMRSLAVAAVLALAPAAASAQLAPRSVALELGFTRESAAALGDRAPLALTASWWLAGDLDLAARMVFGFAARTGGRAADGSYEVGLGLRQALGPGPLRPFASADLALLRAPAGPLSGWEPGLRLGASAGLEAFLSRDLSVAVAASAAEVLLASGSGPSFGLALRVAGYF